MSNGSSDPSEMENESHENRNYEHTDFFCSDTDADSDIDKEDYFDEPIADKAKLENYRKKREDDR